MDVNIGKYVHRDTIIHRLDPRLKLIFNIIFIVMFFVVTHFMTLLLFLLPLLIAFIVATHKPLKLLSLLKMPLFLFIFMMVVYGFIISEKMIEGTKDIQYFGLSQEQSQYIQWHVSWHITKSITFQIGTLSLIRSTVLAVRIFGMIVATTILTYSTKPVLLTKAIEDLLLPLKLLFIPTQIIAMIISIAIRFIPTLLGEASRIMKAQASRGVDFKNGKGKEKVKSLVTLVIPLFVMSFSRAEDLANAMEVRGYDPYAKRSKYRKLVFHWYDYLFLAGILTLVVFVILFEHQIIDLPLWWLYTNQKI